MNTDILSTQLLNYRYIASDCDAVATIYEYQNYTKSPEDAVAIALKSGLILICLLYILFKEIPLLPPNIYFMSC